MHCCFDIEYIVGYVVTWYKYRIRAEYRKSNTIIVNSPRRNKGKQCVLYFERKITLVEFKTRRHKLSSDEELSFL